MKFDDDSQYADYYSGWDIACAMFVILIFMAISTIIAYFVIAIAS
jgi:hypothetical protein